MSVLNLLSRGPQAAKCKILNFRPLGKSVAVMAAETSLYFSRPPADILRAGLAQLRRFHAPAQMIARIEEELYCEGEFGAASELPDSVASFQPNSPEEDVS